MKSDKEYSLIWDSYEKRIGVLTPEDRAYLPDFFVISPAKTCSTWLYKNLISHKDISIERKEMTYFSAFWQWYDVNWYLEAFKGVKSKCKGDVSGTYALLPENAIRHIASLIPNLKIVLTLRHPVERTWSQIRHYYRFKVGPFKNFKGLLKDIPLKIFLKDFWLDSFFLWSDYHSIIKRWLKYIPEKRMFVHFTDGIAEDPHKEIIDLFRFLGVDTNLETSLFPLHKRVLAGMEIDITDDYHDYFSGLFRDSVQKLDLGLNKRFGLSCPREWMTSGGKNRQNIRLLDGHLLPNKDVDRNSLPRFMESFLDYNILFYEGLFHAVSHRSGEIDLHVLNHEKKKELIASGDYFCKENPEELKEHIKTAAYLKA